MPRNKLADKTDRIYVMVESEIKQKFQNICYKNGTTPSEVLRSKIKCFIKKDKEKL